MNGRPCVGKQLRTWGQIADYLNTSVDIAQRWARKYGMPIKKYPSASTNGTVIADADQLDKWADNNIRPRPEYSPK